MENQITISSIKSYFFQMFSDFFIVPKKYHIKSEKIRIYFIVN